MVNWKKGQPVVLRLLLKMIISIVCVVIPSVAHAKKNKSAQSLQSKYRQLQKQISKQVHQNDIISSESSTDLIIFSYDRPMQLFAYLESIEKYITGLNQIFVLYRTSSNDFFQAYEVVKKAFPKVSYHRQPDDNPRAAFKPMLIDLALNQSKSTYLMFGVDDIIVTDDIDIKVCEYWLDRFSNHKFSLRLGKNLHDPNMLKDESFQREARVSIQEIIPGIYQIFYNDLQKAPYIEPCFWSNLHFVDMEIFHKNNMRDEICEVDYDSPNTFEKNMYDYSKNIKNSVIGTLCYTYMKLINLMCNLVREEIDNYMTPMPKDFILSSDLLLDKFNNLRIDINQFYQCKPSNTHVNYPIVFVQK